MNENMNSNSVCVDASMALEWLFYSEHREQADGLLRDWAEEDVAMVAPPMFHAEVISAIRKSVYFKRILPEDGNRLFTLHWGLPVRTIGSHEMYQSAWELAKRFNLPVCYDMQYLAVAELEDSELWTADRRLVNVVRGKNKRVKWLGDYQKRA